MPDPKPQQIYDRQAEIVDIINGGALGRAQAGYATMAANLRGVVRDVFFYTITSTRRRHRTPTTMAEHLRR